QLIRQPRWQQITPRGQGLAELDEYRAQCFQRLAQTNGNRFVKRTAAAEQPSWRAVTKQLAQPVRAGHPPDLQQTPGGVEHYLAAMRFTRATSWSTSSRSASIASANTACSVAPTTSRVSSRKYSAASSDSV